eukprot:CAMPEP_0206248208 /NCGR_PEP_ID=MMETSP0047_2-20121206/20245_1 /ASSEMBLY_ACC=CAM_ASM_000192 /TAXON_ID=195065 /ORGANISM="Chroomonas mesostigmatica_cf, Strain CCMP1168" /LENGTH=142 /DNA_ID=CAMNT_0053673833 /DNA_START=15 /DNA_END=440 /DNA_ORIENTATION=+
MAAANKFAQLQTLSAKTRAGEELPAKSMFHEGGAVIFLAAQAQVRAVREHAATISELAPTLAAKKIRLIAIAGEELGADEFTEKFWKGELFIDQDKKHWFPLMHQGMSKTANCTSCWSYLSGGETAKTFKRMKAKGIENQMG